MSLPRERTKPGGRVNTTEHAWGEVAGRHLLDHPRIPLSLPTSPYWTQAERDRFVSLGILPGQPTLFDTHDGDR